jgi:serine/threonine-protein kinase HipA
MICPGCCKQQSLDSAPAEVLAKTGYCKKCLKELFDGQKVHHILPFNSPYAEKSDLYTDITKKISISGVQVKYSLKLQGNEFVLTERGGQYILKPIPSGQFRNLDQAPANEHLTMQIAKQFFKIAVPPNALVYFQDNSPAYLVRRFDVRPDGSKFQQEDFAQIAQITEETHGKNYKYDLSYEAIGSLIRQYIPMYSVEIEKFFRLVLFNYVFSNGDAHVKNFSAIQTDAGDYMLTPAYDLLCTRIHTPNESDLGLTLFTDDFSEAYQAYGFYTYFDFLLFGKTLGIKENRVNRIIDEFKINQDEIGALIDKSFLKDENKIAYKGFYQDKMKRLKMEWKGGRP